MITDVRKTIAAAHEGKVVVSTAAYEVLNSGWDFRDPTNTLRKTPDEVADFLNDIAGNPMLFENLPKPVHHLMVLIFSAYSTAVAEQ